jgi:hypothetical protein
MTIRLTAKRQATFPRAVCEEMHLSPGNRLTLDREVVRGEKVWVLRPEPPAQPAWLGCLRRYARGKPHGMAAIRQSILEARKRGDL